MIQENKKTAPVIYDGDKIDIIESVLQWNNRWNDFHKGKQNEEPVPSCDFNELLHHVILNQ